ncbi:MAG: GNAT family N-acetyltransferase [Defluviitaleaceae bacterium]|nr:GNAT family N-acetyltransferase [Defluviitaleaceae bacterium]
MLIQVEPILLEQKSVFVQLMNLYNYGFTEYENVDINEYGYYNYTNTDALWNDENWHAFFIRANGALAGFALVHNHCRFVSGENARNIDEFFVMKKYRRMGVGKFAANAVFDMFRGKWEVLQLPNNFPAQKFWKSVISEYTGNNYQECGSTNAEWVGFIFDNSASGGTKA